MHCHQSLSRKSAPDEGAIMNDLSPGLREEASEGDVGMAKYVVNEGAAIYTSRHEKSLFEAGERMPNPGGSFGDEIVMGSSDMWRANYYMKNLLMG